MSVQVVRKHAQGTKHGIGVVLETACAVTEVRENGYRSSIFVTQFLLLTVLRQL